MDDHDTIGRLRDLEILPELFSLLHDLQNGAIVAKDFDNNAGSLRLKLAALKQLLQEVDGISDSGDAQRASIEALAVRNDRKRQFLQSFRERVQREA